MRPIDADALEREYRRQFESVYKHTRDTVLPSDFYIERKAAYDRELVRMEMEAFCEFLKSRPTVDAEPVRHGRWLPKKVGAVTTEFECSECGRTVTHANDYYGKATKHVSSYYPYCHCGAKMDEEVKNEL